MKISGFQKTTLIDYPGKIAAIIFTQGCNFRCGYCHNPELIPINNKQESISETEVFLYLQKRKSILDGVVITGGEPTVQSDLMELIKGVKKVGLLVKLDTNGSNPKLLKELINKKLVDFVAMDIKGKLQDYEQICGFKNTKLIQESIKIILESDVEYEFRTTILPKHHSKNDFDNIGNLLKGAQNYAIQGFRSKTTYLKEFMNESKFKHTEIDEFAIVLRKYIKNVVIRYND
jgi:pyruvate formate lyase activating enzyme